MANELFEAGEKTTVFTACFHGLGMFLSPYILRGGFLDGFDGLVIALTTAGGSFLKYAKLLELQRKGKDK